jgi:hypothetical protein
MAAILLAICATCAPRRAIAAADELLLKEGKTIYGIITQESSDEYTIRTGQNMYLRVRKQSVQSVKRADRGPARLIWKPAISSTTAAPPRDMPRVPQNEISTLVKVKGAVEIDETSARQVYRVQGNTFADVKPSIRHPDAGGSKSLVEPSVTFHASWFGNADNKDGQMVWVWAVVRSTVNASVPRWDYPTSVADADVATWNTFLEKADKRDAERAAIVRGELSRVAESIGALRCESASELRKRSNELFDSARSRAMRRLDEFDQFAGLKRRSVAKAATKKVDIPKK